MAFKVVHLKKVGLHCYCLFTHTALSFYFNVLYVQVLFSTFRLVTISFKIYHKPHSHTTLNIYNIGWVCERALTCFKLVLTTHIKETIQQCMQSWMLLCLGSWTCYLHDQVHGTHGQCLVWPGGLLRVAPTHNLFATIQYVQFVWHSCLLLHVNASN